MLRICLVLLVAATALTAQQQPQRQPLGKGINFYSMEKEAALGVALSRDLLNRETKIEIPEVQGYLEDLVRRLALQLPPDGFRFTVGIIKGEQGALREPIALPGGYLFLSTALLLELRSEDELAGMLAHALSHVAGRHGTRQATREQVANLATTPLIYMDGWTGYGIRQAASTLVPLGMLSFARKFELEADRIAVQVMADAGYDPRAWEVRVERAVDPRIQPVFSPWPPKEQRLAEVRKVIEELPARAYLPHDGLAKIQETLRAVLR